MNLNKLAVIAVLCVGLTVTGSSAQEMEEPRSPPPSPAEQKLIDKYQYRRGEQWDTYVKRVYADSKDPRDPRVGETFVQFKQRVPDWSSVRDEEEVNVWSARYSGISYTEQNRKDETKWNLQRIERVKELKATLEQANQTTGKDLEALIEKIRDLASERNPNNSPPPETVLQAEQVLPLLAAYISAPNIRFRGVIIEQIGFWHEKAKPYLKAIADQGNKEEYLSPIDGYVFNALILIDPQSPQLESFVMERLRVDGLDLPGSPEIVAVYAKHPAEALPLLEKRLLSPNNGSTTGTYATIGKVAWATIHKTMSVEDAIATLRQFPKEYELSIPKTAAAFRVLLEAGNPAKKAVPTLISLLQTTNSYLAVYSAMRVLETTGLDEQGEALKWIFRRLREYSQLDNGPLFDTTSRLLLRIQLGDGSQVPPIVGALAQEGKSLQELDLRLLQTLRQIGPSASPTLSVVWSLFEENLTIGNSKSRGLDTGLQAAMALSAISTGDPEKVDILLNWLESALIKGKKDTGEAAQANYWRSAAALLVLSRWNLTDEQKQRPIVKAILLEGLQADRYLSAATARIIGRWGKDGQPFVKPLLTLIDLNTDSTMTAHFQASMMAIPAASHESRPFLDEHKHLYEDESLTTRGLEAIRALGNISVAAQDAIPVLEKLALDKRHFFRDDAQEALQKIDRRADSPWKPEIDLGEKAVAFSFEDLQNNTYSFGQMRGKLPLFVFMDTQCPCVEAYLTRLKDLDRLYRAQGVQLFGVFSAPQDTREEIQKYVAENGLSFPVILDTDQKLLRRVKATTSAQTLLFDAQGVLSYRGRIDDNVFNIEKVKESTLKEAIVTLLNGRPLKKETTVVGCRIARL